MISMMTRPLAKISGIIFRAAIMLNKAVAETIERLKVATSHVLKEASLNAFTKNVETKNELE